MARNESVPEGMVALDCRRGRILPPYLRSHLSSNKPISERNEDRHLALLVESGYEEVLSGIMAPGRSNPVGRFLSRPEVHRAITLRRQKELGLRFYVGSSLLKRQFEKSANQPMLHLGLWVASMNVETRPDHQDPLPINPATWHIVPPVDQTSEPATFIPELTVASGDRLPPAMPVVIDRGIQAATHFDQYGLPAID